MDKLLTKYNRRPYKANIHNLAALKISLDDLLINFLKTACNIKQDNKITDLRILIGFVSIFIASYITYVSLYQEFKNYKYIVLILILVYYVLNGFIMIIQKFVTKGCIFKATDDSIKVYTSIASPDTNYIVMVYRNGIIPEKYNKNVCDLFDNKGYCQHEVFFNDLKTFFIDDAKKSK